MNILTIIVLVLFALFMLRGYRRGFVKSLASMISLLASVVLVSFVTPYVTEFLQTQTPVYEIVMEKCKDTFSIKAASADGEDKNEKAQSADEKTPESEKTDNQKAQESVSAEKQLQNQLIDSLQLPAILKNMLKNNNTQETYRKLAVDSFNDYVPGFMAGLIMNIISFILTWALVASFIWLAVMTLDVIAGLPVIRGVNQLLGLALGFAQGLIIVWIAFLIITIFSNTAVGKQLLDMISSSPILSWMYSTNVFLDFLQGTVKTIL